MRRNFAVWAMFILVPLTLAAQISDTLVQVGPVPDLSWIGQLRDAGLTGALLVAVYFLWRSREGLITRIDLLIEKKDALLLEKDKQILSMMEHVTASQTAQVETNRELRKIIEDSVKAKQDLTHAIEDLASKVDGCPERIHKEARK